ncbi:MAG TPA: DUF4064 domain-containing protein, partial [Enterococcus sp.]|nr:DUF4064 domain-containing protein [Enterococcus sp.]
PIAFCFFLAAGFCFLHRDDRHKKKTTDTVSKQGGVA